MTPSNTPRPLALSPSRASDYKRCPLQYRFRAIDRLPEPSTEAQVKGTLVHAVLEEMFSWPREERTYPAAVKRLKPTWEQMRIDDPTCAEPVEDDYQLLVDARTLLRGYFTMENPLGFDAHAQEMPVDFTLPNGVPVRGFIDRVDIAQTGEVRVVDYKTGKKPLPRYSQDAQFQMRFYALVYWRLFGVVPTQLKLMYLKVMDSMILTPSREELEYFERDLAELWWKIEADGKAGSFRPQQSKLCGWCAFQSLCPVFGGTPPEYPGWPGSRAEEEPGPETD
ncbi:MULTISPECIES: RecB family exonuclease [Corynebacterium]|uniref:RecB family exonuclease n=1 Tax=Corynebacterium TaxID=1716 RepID=UPI0008A6345A|nr:MULTISPECIES: RecB family exonuclease [Corynebacterium]MDK8663089.1 RecB family exonuclease [Corynebacterium coyleae]MDK8705865.1 RecB family exonuclease [Corynebacterium coyleae]MDK8733048.1 RecB family exonuclease [Corynebacterium coyleae]MDK8891906.1 RecB family exonuclease [Corynebacterium coyleae]OFL16099.1 exodeoxyribonuclease V subunit beta [Corynebacterium sp. HMSC067D03]